ncbi:transmembrane 220 family protein [Salinimicrobium flavum]|uniref:Transmembrane 220 family protein n=1 Tax=Salinimicrobium flavum TaxID=1737065 RepID=A0ABW5ISQ6_9FLAO
MKITNILFSILFIIAAFLQLNDPDPLLWFLLYFSGVVICILGLTEREYPMLIWIVLTIYIIYSTYLLLSPTGVLSWYRDHDAENIAQSMKTDKPWIEETREFFGLLLLIFSAVLNLLNIHSRKKPGTSTLN